LRAIVCCAILIMPGACGTASRGDFCEAYAPVYTSKDDTEPTKTQTDANNAVWLELCQP